VAVSAPELRSWTTPGAQDSAARTYASVKAALSQSDELEEFDYDVFLQGSYANSTNTRGDSDVDIVAMLSSTFMPDISELPIADRVRYEANRIPGTTTAMEFRALVRQALADYYGEGRVHSKNKCIRVDKTSGYVDADVVPALQQRKFIHYPPNGSAIYIEGISIQPLDGGRVVNYPKAHIDNGSAKNERCGGRYKSTVRQIKRLRRRAVELGQVAQGSAPGYLLECMVYNVPDRLFLYDDVARVASVLSWLVGKSPEELANQCMSGDEIHHLFVDDPGQHNEYTAKRVLEALWKVL
jgi:hypothetical protein